MPYLEKVNDQSAEDATRANLMALQARFKGLKGMGK